MFAEWTHPFQTIESKPMVSVSRDPKPETRNPVLNRVLTFLADRDLLPASDPHSLLLHSRMLGERLFIYSCARFCVAAAMALGGPFARYVVGIEDLNILGLLTVAGLLCAYNLVVFFLVLPYRKGETPESARRLMRGVMHATITLDFLFLTIALWLIGGARSPFRAFYILHVIIASVLLSRLTAYFHAFVGYLFFVCLVFGEWWEIIPAECPAGAVGACGPLDGRYVMTVLVVQALLMAFTALFLTGLTRLLRAGEQQLRTANTELERLSRLQRDFLHIALHDIKSPVAAITGLLQSVQSGLIGPLTDQQGHTLDRAQLRLGEVSKFLADLQTLALLGSGKLAEFAEKLSLAHVLREVVEANQDLAQMHRHTLRLELAEDTPEVNAIPALFQEAVANLVTNAIKYTPDGGSITVRGLRAGALARVEVQDNGIGIAPEDQPKLFNEFVRLRRPGTALGNVSGTGLGLSIVQRIMEVHGGTVRIQSEIDKGSTFIIEMPVAG